MPKGKPKFYAVSCGSTPGIYASWEECSANVKGYPSAKYKSFATKREAEQYIEENSASAHQSSSTLQYPSTIHQTSTASNQTSTIQYAHADGMSSPLGSNNQSKFDALLHDVLNAPKAQSPPPSANLTPAPDFISIAPSEPPKTEPPLGPEQQQVLDLVLQGENIFFTGSAGTGKSFLIARIRRALQERGQIVALTAATGIAAVNIGGTTLHKWAGIGMGVSDELIGPAREEQFRKVVGMAYKNRKAWRETNTLIIDEVSMISGYLFDDLDKIGRNIRGVDKPFGGLQIILCGDFLQIPPVFKKCAQKLAFEGSSWGPANLLHIQLRAVYRQSDSEFVSILNATRIGRLNPQMVLKLRQCQRELSTDDGIQPTKVCAKNDMVDRLNSQKLIELTTPICEYEASDFSRFDKSVPKDKQSSYTSILDSFMALSKLQLKQGAQVMLTRNIDDSLVNGSRGVVTGFTLFDLGVSKQYYFDNCHYVEEWAVSTNAKHGKSRSKRRRDTDEYTGKSEKTVQVNLPVVQFHGGRKIVVKPEVFTSETAEYKIVRVQLPLKLAWALTIHKCQGLTLDKVEIDFQDMFAFGQAYVALSRARTLEGLKLIGFDPKFIRTDPKVLRFYETMDSLLDE